MEQTMTVSEQVVTITRGDLRIEVSRKTDRYGQNTAIARLNDLNNQPVHGTVPGVWNRVYPRIEFRIYGRNLWLLPYADAAGHLLDDYETDDEAAVRPVDLIIIDLDETMRQAIQAWRLPYDGPEPWHIHPYRGTVPIYAAEPIYAIGGLNRGDGAEAQAPWPVSGCVCRVCGQAESHGAMFTVFGGDVCDDCGG